ncbi:type 2 periplasmic-binding domain-containing protein [Microbacterium alcoholitolerans]|uniref:hypothetical protein n=1 Tax=unclassified Microbacterium TaxID=2609290 RepID=UPI003D186B6E
MRHPLRTPLSSAAALLLAASLTGCGISIPTDPDRTLENVSGGELRVGASPDTGLIEAAGATPSGPLADLVTTYAAELDASTDWTVDSEETLVGMLEAGDLDLLVGGFTDQTPWVDRAGMTRGYSSIEGADGRKIVMLVPLGENAFLSNLERFLDEEVGS